VQSVKQSTILFNGKIFDEIERHIVSNLDKKSLLNAKLTCKAWNKNEVITGQIRFLFIQEIVYSDPVIMENISSHVTLEDAKKTCLVCKVWNVIFKGRVNKAINSLKKIEQQGFPKGTDSNTLPTSNGYPGFTTG
jgi:hypothetical protein